MAVTSASDELFEAFEKCTDEGLEDSSELGEGTDNCYICSDNVHCPRLLSCLHVFCQACLEKKKKLGENAREVIACPKCQQETTLGRKGVAGLACDYVAANIQDMMAINSTSVVCTSCKTKEQAVARCSDCAHFLCPNCDTAHQYMRCFENHKVVSFEVLKKAKEAVPIHKPVFCDSHPSETMKFFCYTCMMPVCGECVVVDHSAPDHHYERLGDAYERQKSELQGLVAESRAKVAYCEDANAALQNALSELQAQHDNAKGLLQETFQSYKAVLEQRHQDLLDDLKEIHSERELKIMDLFQCVEKTMEQIEDANKFTGRLLEHGSPAEVLSLRHLVSTQLLSLINNTPQPDVNTSLEFVTDMEKFAAAVKASFGHFQKEASPPPTVTTSPQQETPLGLVGNNAMVNGSHAVSSVTSSPVSMPSSFDGDLGLPLTTIQEYNLSALASLATEAATAPSSAPSPTPSFTLNDLFSGDITSTSHAIKNLEALVKLGNQIDPAAELVNGSVGRGSPVDSLPPVLSPVNGMNGGFQLQPRASPTAILPAPGIVPTTNPGGALVAFGQRKASQSMQVRFKFGTLGPSKGQFNSPHGFCLGSEEDIIVADTNNHRIQVFEKNGTFKFQFGIPGKEEGQLFYPRKVAVMKTSGKFVVCDRGNERSRMQIFTKNGHFIKKIAIRTAEWWDKPASNDTPISVTKPRYIDIVAGLAVSSQGNIVAVDSVSPTVFVISETGDLISWFDCSDHMREPSDLAINGKEFFVCDFKGHCVVVFNETGHFLRRIGSESVTNFPNGIDISDAGDVLVGDSHGNRFHVAVFNRIGEPICEFECPYVKVSRCCGLKITSEGYVVTLAKNNHHVLVLNTLYIM